MKKIDELANFTEFQGRPLEFTLTGSWPGFSRRVTYAGRHLGWIEYVHSKRRRVTRPDGTRPFVTTLECYWQTSFDLDGQRPSGKHTPVEEAVAEMVKAAEHLMETRLGGIDWGC